MGDTISEWRNGRPAVAAGLQKEFWTVGCGDAHGFFLEDWIFHGDHVRMEVRYLLGRVLLPFSLGNPFTTPPEEVGKRTGKQCREQHEITE